MLHIRQIAPLIFCLPLLLSCSKPADREGADSKGSEPAPSRSSDAIVRGAALSGAPQVALKALIAQPAAYEGKTVRVSGTARRVCQAKGCWMEIAAALDETAPSCRVAFKDYGFFVPKDSTGKSVTAEGVVQLKRLSKDHVDHYEAEGAVFASKNADGSANELRLVANGVELR